MRLFLMLALTISCSLLSSDPTQIVSAQEYAFILEEADIYYYPPTGEGEGVSTISIEERNISGAPAMVRGLSMGLWIDNSLLTVTNISLANDLSSLNGGSGPGLLSLTPETEGLTIGIVYDIGPRLEFRTYESKTELFVVELQCVSANLQANSIGEIASSAFIDTIGLPPTENVVVVDPAQSIVPSSLETGPLNLIPGTQAFVRGDTNADGSTTLADAVTMSNYLFIAGLTASCIAATDFDNNNSTDVSDIVLLLSYLFSSGNPPASPWPDCGVDPTPTNASCLVSAC